MVGGYGGICCMKLYRDVGSFNLEFLDVYSFLGPQSPLLDSILLDGQIRSAEQLGLDGACITLHTHPTGYMSGHIWMFPCPKKLLHLFLILLTPSHLHDLSLSSPYSGKPSLTTLTKTNIPVLNTQRIHLFSSTIPDVILDCLFNVCILTVF